MKEKIGINKINISEKERQRIRESAKENIIFKGKLFRDVINFWPLVIVKAGDLKNYNEEELKKFFSSLEPIPYYQEGYKKQGQENYRKTMNERGDLEAERYKIYFEEELRLIMELSDSEQIKKYDNLVEKYNAALFKMKENLNIDVLQGYCDAALEIIDEKPEAD